MTAQALRDAGYDAGDIEEAMFGPENLEKLQGLNRTEKEALLQDVRDVRGWAGTPAWNAKWDGSAASETYAHSPFAMPLGGLRRLYQGQRGLPGVWVPASA